MTLRVGVGVSPACGYAMQVLEQSGLAAVSAESVSAGMAQGLRVFFWGVPETLSTAPPMPGERTAIITTHACLRQQQGRTATAVPATSFHSEAGPFSRRGFYARLPVCTMEGDTFGSCRNDEGHAIPGSGIAVIREADCLLVSLPWDIFAYEQGEQWQNRPYYSAAVGKHFVEIGPALDTAAFRRLLEEILLCAFSWVDLPLVRVSPRYKNGKHFAFRVDADGFSESGSEAALRVAEKTGLPFTWFLDVAFWKRHATWIRHLLQRGQSVQLHCYRHMAYRNREVNKLNIRKGLKILADRGVQAKAIVCPLGYHYRGFSEAIREFGFTFSSEFGYAADDLPSRPWNDANYPLQIPVHPACSGVLRDAGFSAEEQFAHLESVARRQVEADGICMFYDHPIGGLENHESAYTAFFRHLGDEGYEYLRMEEFAAAWQSRPRNVAIWLRDGRLHVDGFEERGFCLEHVAPPDTPAVSWQGGVLPKAQFANGKDEFPTPPEWCREAVRRRNACYARQRAFSPLQWRLYESLLELGRITGYLAVKRMLARSPRLRAWRDRLRRSQVTPQCGRPICG